METNDIAISIEGVKKRYRLGVIGGGTLQRDLHVLVEFGVSLWMYATPIIYSASTLPPEWSSIILLNPVAPIIELLRYGWLGAGTTPFFHWGISWATTFVVLFLGVVIFNRVEKTFMDTV